MTMRRVLPVLMLALALPGAAAAEDLVVIDGATWAWLQPPDEPEPAPLPGPFAASRTVRLEALADGRVAVDATWRIETFEPGWLDLPLLHASPDDARVTWDGGPAAWDATEGVVVTGWVDRPVEVRLVTTMPGDPRLAAVALPLGDAVRGDVTVVATPEFDLTLGGALPLPSGAWTAAGPLSLRLEPAAGPRDRGTRAYGGVAIGLTVGDSELAGRARLRWRLQHGSLDRLQFTAHGLGPDVEVTGATVRDVRRDRDRFTVELQSPADDLVTLDLTWTADLPRGAEGRVVVPDFSLDGADRVEEAALQLARDGDWQAVPDLSGWRGRAASAAPRRAPGLLSGPPTPPIEGTPPGRGGHLALLRFEPVSGPPVIVDVADFLVATTAEGRQLIRVKYDVRNDVGHQLLVTPPPGARLLAVQVRGEAATPVRQGEHLAIPLPRSVETVEGLISLPVELAFLVEGDAWGRREDRELVLPAVDAPVAASRVSLHLPPGYSEARRQPGRRVDSFTEGGGIAYGFVVSDETGRDQADQADALFQSAVDSWLDNDFDQAQARLDELEVLGASNDNTLRLQSNIDLVYGGDEDADEKDRGGDAPAYKAPAEETMRRRVREQARARSESEYRQYEEVQREAERQEAAGEYEAAERSYSQALELGKKLEGLEEEESSEVEADNFRVSDRLAEVRTKRKAKEDRDTRARAPASPAPPPRGRPGRVGGVAGLGGRGEGRGGGGGGGPFSRQSVEVTVTEDDEDSGLQDGSRTSTQTATGSSSSAGTTITFEDVSVDGEFVVEGRVGDPHSGSAYGYEGEDVAFGIGDYDGVADDRNQPDFQPMPEPTPDPAIDGPFQNASAPPLDTPMLITASTRSVPVPRVGEPLLYQQLLVPAGAAPSVVVRARRVVGGGGNG